MSKIELKQIGRIKEEPDGFRIELESEFREGLTAIDGFSWLSIIWWASHFESDEYRSILCSDKPYKKGPDKIGVFATRSPLRPNPLAVTPVYISRIDLEAGVLYTPYIDAADGTPVIDIKPYHGSTDRVDAWEVPSWCSHWPETVEASADFAWEDEFNF